MSICRSHVGCHFCCLLLNWHWFLPKFSILFVVDQHTFVDNSVPLLESLFQSTHPVHCRSHPKNYDRPNCYLFVGSVQYSQHLTDQLGSDTLVLTRVLHYFCCRTPDSHQRIGVPSVYRKQSSPLLLRESFFQSPHPVHYKSHPENYDSPNCYLFCWQCLVLATTLTDLGLRHLFSPKFSVTFVARLQTLTNKFVCPVSTPSEVLHCHCKSPCSSCLVQSIARAVPKTMTDPIATSFVGSVWYS